VRCRPLSQQERADGRKQIVGMDVREGQVQINNPRAVASDPPKLFTYDQVYDWNSEQYEIFSVTARPIVESVMSGYNGTIFAYGQTGTGGQTPSLTLHLVRLVNLCKLSSLLNCRQS
jgi:kinesin family member 3A